MPKDSSPPGKLLDCCRRWSDEMVRIESSENRIAYFEENLPELLQNRALVKEILDGIAGGAAYGERHGGMLFDNEVLLYLDRARRFSLRMYIHVAGDYTFVHDHSAWGVLGSAVGRLHIVKYHRRDDGSRKDRASLRSDGESWLAPGQTAVTLPLDAGIHKTGNASDDVLVVINVYGTPMRRLYINQFNPESGAVFRLYPPRLQRKKLAAAALEAICDGSAVER